MRRRGRLVLLVSTVGAVVLALVTLYYALTPTVSLRGRVTFEGVPNHAIYTLFHPDATGQIPDESFLMQEDGSLANVLVYIEDASAADGAPGEPMRVVQRNCLLRPRVLGVRVGQPIEFTNEDRFSHNLRCYEAKRNPAFNHGFVRGDRWTKTFENAEVLPFSLGCDVHFWERAHIGVFDHPFFAVTGPDGTFAFPERLRPGVYTIVAWHERLGKIEQRVVCFRPRQTVLFSFAGSTRGEGEVRPR